MERYLYLNHSKQKTEIIKAHVLLHKTSIVHVTTEKDVRVLNPKGLINEYLGTQEMNNWEPKT
jgi:hypothetical protein